MGNKKSCKCQNYELVEQIIPIWAKHDKIPDRTKIKNICNCGANKMEYSKDYRIKMDEHFSKLNK
jgi:hypothetical protein